MINDTATLKVGIKNKEDSTAPLTVAIVIDGVAQTEETYRPGKELIHTFTISDEEAEHTLEIFLKGKTYDHTKLDVDGNVVADSLIEVTVLELEDIDVMTPLRETSTYVHSYNNPDLEPVSDEFNFAMGCNGTVTMKFSTPAFIWLLENI